MSDPREGRSYAPATARMNSVFTRSAQEAAGPGVGVGAYNFIIGAVLCWGFLINWLLVQHVPTAALLRIPPLIFFLGYFGCCVLGASLFNHSTAPLVSFLGYNLVVVPFGLVVNLVVSRYDPALVLEAIRITTLVTVTMMLAGAMAPAFFQRISTALAIALLGVIVWECVEVFFFHLHHGAIDWIVAAIFCGYVGVDWGRANRIPKTVDNAIDSAAALYMDIINLFVRILSILGRRK